jgi:hypothetical protein
MTPLDDDLLAALRAARPDPGYQPSATSPQAQAMLARVLKSADDPAARRHRLAHRRWRRTLVLAGLPALAVTVAAAVLAISLTSPARQSAAANLRAAVLDAFERDGGDIIYTMRTIQVLRGPAENQQIWTYPAVPTAGQQIRVRLFQWHSGEPVEDTESVYEAGPQSDRITQSTTSGPRFAEITDVEYATRTWSRLLSSTPLVASSLDPDKIRQQIANGGFTVVGTVRLQGRPAVELTWSRRLGPARIGMAVTTGLWVDPRTYMPLRSITTQWAGPSGHRRALFTDTANYRVLEPTRANLALLTPPIPVGFTRTTTSPHYAPYTG